MADDSISLSFEIEKFVKLYKISYCKLTQRIYVYDDSTGLHYPVDDIELSKLVDEFINSDETSLDWCDYNMSMIIKYVKTKAPYYESMGRKGRTVFNNATFHWKDMTVRKHSSKDRATASLGVDFDPEAECPVFDRYISQLANGDKNMRTTFYQIAGYVASHSQKHSKLVLLVSQGGSGKSVYLKTLEALVGTEYTSKLSISEINNPNRAFDRLDLLDSRLNIVHELGEKETMNSIFSANVKKIVSGEEISCERKFGSRTTFTPKISMIVVASNHCPLFEGMPSESIRRRLLILNITKVLAPEEQDEMLFQKIKAELAGVFNKAVKYYQLLKENNFVFASEADSRAFIDNQIIESFPMYSFVNQYIVVKPGHKLMNEILREKYAEWAAEHDVDVTLDSKGLMKSLANTIQKCHIPFKREKSNGVRYLLGIDIKN